MKEWGRKPYISKSYHDMMKKVTNRAKWNQRLEKQSEFEKPYKDENYAEMQHYHSKSNSHLPGADYPDMPVSGIPFDTCEDIKNKILEIQSNRKLGYMMYVSKTYEYLWYLWDLNNCGTGYWLHTGCMGDDVEYPSGQDCIDVGEVAKLRWRTHPDDPIVSCSSEGALTGVFTFGMPYTIGKQDNVDNITYVNARLDEESNSQMMVVIAKTIRNNKCSQAVMFCQCDCDGISIGYTTQGMSVDEEQVLTAEGAVEGCTYTWAISSGGGELSAETGTSVTYTAPATNPECEYNPTITLSCEGQVCDTLEIAVNVGAWPSTVFVVNDIHFDALSIGDDPLSTTCIDSSYYILASCSLTGTWYGCNGTPSDDPCEVTAQLTFTPKYDKDGNRLCTKDLDGKYYLCVDDDWDAVIDLAGRIQISSCLLGSKGFGIYGLAWIADNSPLDARSEALITAGCCPPQLL
jgi:hypothetical protein